MKRQELQEEFEEGYEDYLNNVIWDRAGNSRLDYAYDVPGYCGDWCPCGSNLENWMDWLRSQDVYPANSNFAKLEDLFRVL